MDTLPLELHSQIFESACTDDGTTARSLSLVSRYVHEVARPFLLQSIAVSGLRPLTELATRLANLPTPQRRVRHLFLSDWTRQAAGRKTVSSDDADMDRYEIERTTIVRVLELVAPTLESFSFVASCPFTSTSLIGHLFALHFPVLEDLSVHGFYPFPSSHANMPNLKRLRLSGNRNPHGIFQTGGIHTAAPKLAHLHISGLVSATSFAEELENALLPENDANQISRFPASLPPSLKGIRISLGPSPAATRRFVSARAQHQKMAERLSSLAEIPDDFNGVRLEVAEEADISCYDRLRQEWARSFVTESRS